MTVSVQRFTPKQKQEEESDLNKIYKGVQILTGAVDLGGGLIKAVRDFGKPDLEKETKEIELGKKKREEARDIETEKRKKLGVLQETFITDMLPKLDISEVPKEGFHGFDVVKPSGEVYKVYGRSKKTAGEEIGLLGAIRGLTLTGKQREERVSKAKEEFDLLPVQSQEMIKKLAGSSANKETINNQIKGAISQLDNPDISDDQKLTIGRSLLKTLNSTEGSDAVGAEEANRLGSYLEFKIANFTGPGSFVGRDLDQFIEQTRLTSERIDKAIESNNEAIERLYGRAKPKFENDVLEFAKKKGISPAEALKIKNKVLQPRVP